MKEKNKCTLHLSSSLTVTSYPPELSDFPICMFIFSSQVQSCNKPSTDRDGHQTVLLDFDHPFSHIVYGWLTDSSGTLWYNTQILNVCYIKISDESL